MKFLSLLLGALMLALPLRAQDGADASKEFSLTLNYSFSEKTHVSSVEFVCQRNLANGKSAPFDSSIIGKKGLISQETLSFLNDQGDVLGKLFSTFDANGKLQSQSMSETNHESHALNWFKTALKSPELSVAGSIMKVSYALKNGRLSDRLLMLRLPAGTREFRTHYDGQGRLESEVNASASGPITVRFYYAQQGLIRFTTAGAGDKNREVILTRADNGSVSQMVTTEEGVLVARLFPNFNGQGQNSGMRIESFDEGILSTVAVMNLPEKRAVKEDYDDGVLALRKTFSLDTTAGQKIQSLEEFEAGHLQKRTQYDENGAVKNIATFKADGSIDTIQNFVNGVEVPATP